MKLRALAATLLFLIPTTVYNDQNRFHRLRNYLESHLAAEADSQGFGYETLPHLEFTYLRKPFSGLYLPQEETIRIDERWTPDNPMIWKSLINHELMHYWVAKHLWQGRELTRSEKVVDEGFATVAEFKSIGKPIDNCTEYLKERRSQEQYELFYSVKYGVGACIAKPIMDEFGIRGMKWLVDNPPTMEELEQPDRYLDNSLAELSAGHGEALH